MVDSLPNTFRLGPWRVLRDQNRLERAGAEHEAAGTRLEPKAMDVLAELARSAGNTVTREELLEKVWDGRLVVEGTLSRVILALRQALGDDAKAPLYIETVPKRGYRLLMVPTPDGPTSPRVTPAAATTVATVAAADLAPLATPALRASRRWSWIACAVLLIAISLVYAWPRIQLERATSSGIGAMEYRGEGPGDRAVLREELRQLRSGRVLWVDNEPQGNHREITTLEQAGLIVDVATSNAAAAEQMRGREYDLLISDIGRPPPETRTAGLNLPREVVPDRNRLPPIVYYAHRVAAPRTADGYPVTNKASELFRLVSDVFRWRQTSPQLRPLERPVTAPSK